jgi:NADPH:quinone reductase-like Zn-dependent oxidoreductase
MSMPSCNGFVDFSQKGDRVAAFHEMGAPGGSYAEYALAWDWTTFHIPETTGFEGKSQSLNPTRLTPQMLTVHVQRPQQSLSRPLQPPQLSSAT